MKLGPGLLSAKQAHVTRAKRSSRSRTELRLRSEPVDEAFEALVDRVGSLLGALGIFIVAGVIVAGIGIWIFSELAERVMSGGTHAFDEAVLRWAAFCTAMLEGIQRFSQRRAPEVMKHEAPAPKAKS